MEKKILEIKGIPTLVTFSGEGRNLLCLHGWGKEVDHHAFDELRTALKGQNFRIIVPDFPGFGESAEPPIPWSVGDYADCIEGLVAELNLNDVLLLGHSFGGRVAIKLASRNLPWISRLYLCAAAGVGRDLLVKRRFWLSVAKIGNAFCSLPIVSHIKPLARRVLYKLLRVHDYHDASENMRMTMAEVVAEDLTLCLPKITVPTDLFWGEEDTITPLKDAKLMNTKIDQSVLHSFEGVRHRVHRHRAQEIASVLRQAL